MISKMRSVATVAVLVSGFAASQNLVAATCATPIDYQLSGHFGTNVVKGPDGFKLAGEPFSISLYACEGKAPSAHKGQYEDIYTGIALTGTVKSADQSTPFTIKSTPVTFVLDAPPTGNDEIQLSGNLNVYGTLIAIHGTISLPPGTLASPAIGPFPSASVITAKSSFTYSFSSWQANTAYKLNTAIVDPAGNEQEVTTAGTSGATAPVWNETLNGTTTDGTAVWTCKGPYTATQLSVFGTGSGTVVTTGGVRAGVSVHGAVDVITARAADGTQSVRPLRSAPVDLSASTDRTMLRFYASGVRYASDVHVEIAGQQVPVVHAGPSADFAGLDEVTVDLPHSLAGMGRAEMILTVDGEAASPVPVHIQ